MNGTRVRIFAILLTLVVSTGATPAATADPASRSGITVVAQGLAAPRGIVYDARTRRVLVAEAGSGGPSEQQGGNCVPIGCYGPTGAVLEYSERTRTSRRIIEGLPSIGFFDDTGTERISVLGLHDLSLDRYGQVRLLFGLTGDGSDRTRLGPVGAPLGQLARLRGHPARLDLEADLMAFEQRKNPDLGSIESNPFGMISGPFGTLVADASANDVLLVRPGGAIETVAVFPARTPAANPNDRIDSVPTTVVRGPDGASYVGELTGFPFYKGEAKVWRVVPGRTPTIYAEGFTNIADITFDERGRLTVLEMAKEGLFVSADPVTGRLVRVEANGSRTDLATTGLENPGGVAYAGDGVYYVTNRTVGAGVNGQLLRIKVRG